MKYALLATINFFFIVSLKTLPIISKTKNKTKKVKCDGRTNGRTDRRTDGPTKRGVESRSTRLKSKRVN